jgi:hypothetical protein
MQRTQSSLLSFNLREFLDTTGEVPMSTIAEADDDALLRHTPAKVAAHCPSPQHAKLTAHVTVQASQPVTRSPQGSPPKGAVWVDCAFYGFYMDESKVEGFRRTVNSGRSSPAEGWPQQPGVEGAAIAVF